MRKFNIPDDELTGFYSFMDLDKIILNDNLKILHCTNNKLTKLKINKDLDFLYCWNNEIKDLILNDKLVILEVDMFTNVEKINNPSLKILFLKIN